MRSHGIFLFETFLCKTYRPHPSLYKLLSHLGWIHTCIYNSQVPQSWLGISWWFFGAMWNYSRVGNEMAVKMHQLLNLSFICLCIHLILRQSHELNKAQSCYNDQVPRFMYQINSGSLISKVNSILKLVNLIKELMNYDDLMLIW